METARLADRGTVKSALERLEGAADGLASLSLDALSHTDLLAVADRLEALTRRKAVVEHRLVGRLAAECAPAELGAKSMAEVLARRLRISRAEARRRIADAQVLGPRTAMGGEKLDPLLPHTAAGVAAGVIGVEHVRIIRTFFDHLPCTVDAGTRAAAEADLAEIAAGFTPDQLTKAADRLMTLLDQDGNFSDGDRARKRGIAIGKQGYDGMSTIGGLLDPELRATLEAVLAKLAAPGMCNPDSAAPQVDGSPSEEEIRTDLRSPAQRNHDGMKAGLRALLASGELGQHNGLPATIIVSTTSTGRRPAPSSGGDPEGPDAVIAVQCGGRHQVVRSERFGHRNALRQGVLGDPIGDPAMGQEPRCNHDSTRTRGAQPQGRLGQRATGTGGKRDTAPCPTGFGPQSRCDRGGSGVGAVIRRAHCRNDHSDIAIVARHTGLGQTLPQHTQQGRVGIENIGAAGLDSRCRDDPRDIHPGVIGVGQQQRCDHRRSAGRCQHVGQAGRGALEERHPHVELRSQPADASGHGVCHRGGPRVDAAVRGEDQRGVAHACSPHSVLVRPCQRPLRGSVPGSGLAVHGAQPIDG
jgi:hypothetical protein